MKFRLFAVLAILFLGVVQARAEITLGLAVSNPLVNNEAQALRFDAYLEKHLGASVVIRVVADEKDLHDWVKVYREVDLALFSSAYLDQQAPGEFIRLAVVKTNGAPIAAMVGGPSTDPAILEQAGKVLVSMVDDPEGVMLLSDFGVSRFDSPGAGGPAPTVRPAIRSQPPARRSPVVPVPRPTRPAAATPALVPPPARTAEPAKFSLGIVDAVPPLGSEGQARRLASYLQGQLDDPVAVRVFPSEKVLQDWIGLYREIDLGVFSTDYLKRHVALRLFPLADIHSDSGSPQGEALAQVVTGPGKPAAVISRIQGALLNMNHDPAGAEVMSQLGIARLAPPEPVAVASSPRVAAPAPVRPPRAQAPVPAAVRPVITTSRTAPKAAAGISLGLAASTPNLGSEARGRRLAAYLQEQLGAPVTVRVLPSPKVVYDWVGLYREVDLAVLDADFVRRQPFGRLVPLAELAPVGGGSPLQLVAGPGLQAGLLDKTQNAMLQAGKDSRDKGLLAALDLKEINLPTVEAVPTPRRVAGGGAVPVRPRATEPKPADRRPPSKLVAVPSPVSHPRPAASAAVAATAPASRVPVQIPAARGPVAASSEEAPLPPSGLRAEMEGRWEDAVMVYESTVRAEPKRVDLWRRIADIQSLLGRPHEAALSLLWAVSEVPQENPLYLQLAQAHSVNGQLQAALAACRRALDLDPENSDYLRVQAQLASWVGDLDLVRESYRRLLARGWREDRNRLAGN